MWWSILLFTPCSVFYVHDNPSLPCFSSLTVGSSDEDSSFIFSIPASFLGLSSSPPFSFPHFAFGEGGMVSEASFDVESPALAPVNPSDGSDFSLGASFSGSFRVVNVRDRKRKFLTMLNPAICRNIHGHTKPHVQPALHAYTVHTHTPTHLPL